MSKKIIVIGNGSYSQTIRYYIETITDWEIVAYADEADHYNEQFQGKPMVSMNDMVELFPPEVYEVVIGVGYLKMNENRKRIYNRLKSMGYILPNLIHSSAILNNTQLGDANIILENVVVEPNSVIMNNCIIWSAVLIGHNATVESHNHFAACALIAGNSYVEESCFLGNHCTVRDGVRIADHTLIGAGTYVSKDNKSYDVIVPARSVVLDKHKSTDFL